MPISNEKMRQAFAGLMARTGRPIERLARTSDRRGPTVEVYRLPSGQTLRLRTNNKPALMARAASGAADARLPFETEDFVGIAFPAERPNLVVGYLVPTEIVVQAMHDNQREWLANGDHGHDNETRVLRFDGDARSLGNGYANRWSEYRLGEIELDASPPPPGRSTTLHQEIADARRKIAAACGRPESAVRIAIDF